MKITQKRNLRILGFCKAVLSCVTPAKVEYLQLGTQAYLHRLMMLALRMLLFSGIWGRKKLEKDLKQSLIFLFCVHEIGSRGSKAIVQTASTNMNVTYMLKWNFSFIEISREKSHQLKKKNNEKRKDLSLAPLRVELTSTYFRSVFQNDWDFSTK